MPYNSSIFSDQNSQGIRFTLWVIHGVVICRVEQGQAVARVGATGRATGPHLHWGMSWFDVRIDPLLVLER